MGYDGSTATGIYLMAQNETDILNRVRLRMTQLGYVTLRNNTGMFLTLDGQRRVMAGLGKGSADLIGWKTVTITPDMVGKKIAIFTAAEIKTETGYATPEQKHFLNTVALAGGRAFLARSPEDIKIPGEGESPGICAGE